MWVFCVWLVPRLVGADDAIVYYVQQPRHLSGAVHVFSRADRSVRFLAAIGVLPHEIYYSSSGM